MLSFRLCRAVDASVGRSAGHLKQHFNRHYSSIPANDAVASVARRVIAFVGVGCIAAAGVMYTTKKTTTAVPDEALKAIDDGHHMKEAFPLSAASHYTRALNILKTTNSDVTHVLDVLLWLADAQESGKSYTSAINSFQQVIGLCQAIEQATPERCKSRHILRKRAVAEQRVADIINEVSKGTKLEATCTHLLRSSSLYLEHLRLVRWPLSGSREGIGHQVLQAKSQGRAGTGGGLQEIVGWPVEPTLAEHSPVWQHYYVDHPGWLVTKPSTLRPPLPAWPSDLPLQQAVACSVEAASIHLQWAEAMHKRGRVQHGDEEARDVDMDPVLACAVSWALLGQALSLVEQRVMEIAPGGVLRAPPPTARHRMEEAAAHASAHPVLASLLSIYPAERAAACVETLFTLLGVPRHPAHGDGAQEEEEGAGGGGTRGMVAGQVKSGQTATLRYSPDSGRLASEGGARYAWAVDGLIQGAAQAVRDMASLASTATAPGAAGSGLPSTVSHVRGAPIIPVTRGSPSTHAQAQELLWAIDTLMAGYDRTVMTLQEVCTEEGDGQGGQGPQA